MIWLKAFPSRTFFRMLPVITKLSFLELNLFNLIFSSVLIPAIFTFNQFYLILFLPYLAEYSFRLLSWKAPLSIQKYFTEFTGAFYFSNLAPTEQYFSMNLYRVDPYQKSLSQVIPNHQHQCQIIHFQLRICFQMPA